MKRLILYSFIALAITACSESNESVVQPEEGRVPIRLSSRLNASMQRNSRQDVQIASGQQVSFFVTRTGNPADYAYNNAQLTADGVGNFDYSYNGQDTLFFPIYTDNVDFYGIHPFNSSINLQNTHSFSVQQNQSDIRDFLNSDLLYIDTLNITRTLNPITLQFNHMLTKLTFEIVAGPGVVLDSISSVEVLNVQTQTSINPVTGEIIPVESDPAEIVTYGLADREIPAGTTQLDDISAIIVPQQFNAQAVAPNNRLFRLTINGVNFYYTPPSNIIFESGKSYNYILTLTAGGLQVTSTIVDWDHAQDTEGEGIID